MISVKQELDVYELDGRPLDATDPVVALGVHSHSNQNDLVVLMMGGLRYAVMGADLVRAIKNAMNIDMH